MIYKTLYSSYKYIHSLLFGMQNDAIRILICALAKTETTQSDFQIQMQLQMIQMFSRSSGLLSLIS